MAKKKGKTVNRNWAHIVKNPKGYIDPYKVVVGGFYTFHSWHSSRASALREASRINKEHPGYREVV